jgi:hypothetical protein
MTRHPLRRLAALAPVALGLALAGCGSSSDDSATTVATGGTATTDAPTTSATTAAASATSATAGGTDGSTAAAADDATPTVIQADVAGGEVSTAEDRVEVAQGTDVVIRVTTDVEEPVHLHGYDIEVDAAPGQPAEIAFTADIPGVFEVELEDSGTLLFEIEVK